MRRRTPCLFAPGVPAAGVAGIRDPVHTAGVPAGRCDNLWRHGASLWGDTFGHLGGGGVTFDNICRGGRGLFGGARD